MKKMMSIAAIALFMAGASAFACDSCGCQAKKAEEKTACCSTNKTACCKKAGEKKCAEDCKKECCAKKSSCTKKSECAK